MAAEFREFECVTKVSAWQWNGEDRKDWPPEIQDSPHLQLVLKDNQKLLEEVAYNNSAFGFFKPGVWVVLGDGTHKPRLIDKDIFYTIYKEL